MSKIWFGLLGAVSMSMLMACGDSSSTSANDSENGTESSSSIGGNNDIDLGLSVRCVLTEE